MSPCYMISPITLVSDVILTPLFSIPRDLNYEVPLEALKYFYFYFLDKEASSILHSFFAMSRCGIILDLGGEERAEKNFRTYGHKL